VRLLLLLISFYTFSIAASATQYPYGDSTTSLSQPYSPPGAVETYLTPYDNAEARLIAFLDQAQHYCYIASYSLTNPNVVNKLIQLHNRGVDVEILTDKTQAAGKNEQAALAALQANGIPIFAGKSVANALMHCKFCVIDDHLIEDGSWNFTASANREDNILNFTNSKQRAMQFLAYWLKIRSDMKN
jgi:phosphatidylserine/phosphatidylglycerophosphate/cardiolipin synthase-like enzyme